ncbi:MAG: SIS domain-containing protein [Kiritimatiellia bacterium]
MKKNPDIALVSEMFETANIIRNFDFSRTDALADEIRKARRVFLTGEGSSRILPAHNFISTAMRLGVDIAAATEGSYQAMDYDLSSYVVLAASNSGKTKETLTLVRKLNEQDHGRVFGVTASAGSPLDQEARDCIVLSCGWEKAVAATKSVVEQALVYQSILAHLVPGRWEENKIKAATLAEAVMAAETDPALVEAFAAAGTIFFSGRNNGVAEELALKTNEIVRKPSRYLEGTLALHGIEEIMVPEDVVVFLDPPETEFATMEKIFIQNIGASVVVIGPKATPFPTLVTPLLDGYSNFLALMAGWNLLVEAGLKLGFNLDKPARARKVGNAI